MPTPNLPETVEAVVVPVTTSVPLIVVVSVMESPRVVLPSTVNVDADVVESVTEPTEVRLFTKTSPSTSTRNFTDPFTIAEKRLLSATALEGLITRAASNAPEFAAPVVHEENVCGIVGALVASNAPLNVEVALVDDAVRYEKMPAPENVPPPEAVMSPTVSPPSVVPPDTVSDAISVSVEPVTVPPENVELSIVTLPSLSILLVCAIT